MRAQQKTFFSGSAVRGNVNGGRVEWSVGIRFIVNSLPRQLWRALESFNIRLTLSTASKLCKFGACETDLVRYENWSPMYNTSDEALLHGQCL